MRAVGDRSDVPRVAACLAPAFLVMEVVPVGDGAEDGFVDESVNAMHPSTHARETVAVLILTPCECPTPVDPIEAVRDVRRDTPARYRPQKVSARRMLGADNPRFVGRPTGGSN
jgi:hypothetical protein